MTIRFRRAQNRLRVPDQTACLCVLLVVVSAWTLPVLAEEGSPVIPIGEALADRDGDTVPDLVGRTVRVRGTVTIPTGVISDAYLQAFIQDETGGILLFDRKVERDVAIGDVVEATGQIDQYRGAIQLINPRYEITGRQDPPAVRTLTVRDAASWSSYGRLVRVTGVLGEATGSTATILPLRALANEDDASIDVFLPRRVEVGLADAGLRPGTTVAVNGVVSIRAFDRPYLEGFQIIVRHPSDVEILKRPAPPWLRGVILGVVILVVAAVVAALANLVWRRRVSRREQQLGLVSDLSTVVVSPHLDRKQLLDAAVRLIRERLGARGVAIQLPGSNGETGLAACDGMPDEDADLLRGETFSGESDVRARTRAIATLEERGYHLVARLPISGRNRALGILTVFSGRRIVSPETVSILATAAGVVGLGLENTDMARESAERESEMRQLAITDDLTGLYNRRFLEEYLRIQLPMAHRQRESMAFITLDIDGFKSVNDRWGHDAGDRVLARVGEILRVAARASDLPVRLAGEEFLIAMPQTDAAGARIFAERLLETVADADFTHIDRSGTLRITASAGVSAFPEHGDRIRVLLRKADDALDAAKNERNAVRVARG